MTVADRIKSSVYGATGGRSSPDASSISDTLASFSTILNKTTLKLSDVKPEKQELELCSWIHNKLCVIISNVTPKPVKGFFFWFKCQVCLLQ